MAINKAIFIAAVAKKCAISQANAAYVLDQMAEVASETLKSGETIDIRGFIKLEPVNKPARTGRNPSTGVAIEIPAKTVVKATASKALLGGA